ncbi:MAG: hypothetical protein HS110_18250 [Zoogloeaceae bacterium]|jgi:hypothetical protein|nr:hypothetical protein [Zoogloeaceae bacterium]MBL8502241.1 hypothetical protein [Rhodocyclaceae bacterium]MCK6384712.1 hypothetical protein [Rhodocyclaceae bacterium]
MSKHIYLMLCGFLVLPAQAGLGPTVGETVDAGHARVCGFADLIRLSPTNPNDPLFPPSQWPKCTA